MHQLMQVTSRRRVLSTIQRGDPAFRWGRTTLHKALKNMGFSFSTKRDAYYDRLREEPDNIIRRMEYLQRRKLWLQEGRPMVYMDESWVNQNTSTSKSWSDGTPQTVDTIPPGKGPRWIMIGGMVGYRNHSGCGKVL